MPDELATCSACGTQNAIHRSVCLKCGVSLSAKEPPAFIISATGASAFPNMNEDLGRVVSQFVEKRVDEPEPRETDLWCEAVYAALFSVAFEIVTRLKSAKGSQEDLERETKAIIEGTCAHAAPWVNARLAEDIQQSIGVRVQYDDASLIRYRMLMYFNVAYNAMAERDYEKGVARSHACWAILSEAVSQLMKQYGEMDKSTITKYREIGLMPPSEEEAISFVRKAWESSESMSREIGEVLDSKATSVSDSPSLSGKVQEAAKYVRNKFEDDRQLIIIHQRDLNKRKDYQKLDDIPIKLADAIRAVWRQAEAFASSGDPVSSGLMPKKRGDLLRDLHTYDEHLLRLQAKLESFIPNALRAVRSINAQVQPRFYKYTEKFFLDVLKYDIRDAANKNSIRRMIERSWKRVKGDYLR